MKKTKKNDKNVQKNVDNLQKTKNIDTNLKRDEHTYCLNNKSSGQKNSKKKHSRAVIMLAISCAVLGVSTLGLGIAYGVSMSLANDYKANLSAVYQKSYYDLADNIDNAETKTSKILNTTSASLQRKYLLELSENCKMAQASVASLPLASSKNEELVSFINKLSGYTSTLAEQTAQGEELSADDLLSLQKIDQTLQQLKTNINKFSSMVANGYDMMSNISISNGTNDFTLDFSQITNLDVEIPTMIYDGPFSDSVLNTTIYGLTGKNISKEDAFLEIERIYSNISSLSFDGETSGKFDTYNFNMQTTDNDNLFLQVTKIGGHILTVCGNTNAQEAKISVEEAKKIAIDFAEKNGIEGCSSVWSQTLGGYTYFNLAPSQNDIVLYPDLVKVKVDMGSGSVEGYDATSYFINHKDRELQSAGTCPQSLLDGLSDYKINSYQTVLAPLDYNREVLCYEICAEKDDETYYFYFNANTCQQENVLKVVETTDGNKLM